MLASVIVSLLAGQAAAAPRQAARHNAAKRSTETATLYAYGTDIAGYAVYAGSDDLAYIVADDAAAAATANMTALTWTIDTTGADAWTVQANSTAGTSSAESTSMFYLVTADAAFEQTGFVAAAADAPSGATTTGLATYGPYVMLLDGQDGSTTESTGHNTLVSEFWAANTSVAGVWELRWNSAGTTQTGSVPVTLQTKDPVRE